MNIPEITKESVNAFNELTATKLEFECLRKERGKAKKENDFLKSELDHTNKRIEFLKGQVNAYQYALNCRK